MLLGCVGSLYNDFGCGVTVYRIMQLVLNRPLVVDLESDGDDRLQAIVVYVPRNVPVTLFLNCSEFPNS